MGKIFYFENTTSNAFVNSTLLKAYPCGRRRGVSSDNENQYIPFDPEARLNTELNNRSGTSINGYKNSYLKSYIAGKEFTISIDGYNFTINMENSGLEDTVDALIGDTGLVVEGQTAIYANILIQRSPIFADSAVGNLKQYYTYLLKTQTGDDNAALDLFKNTEEGGVSDPAEEFKSIDNYYFSGLSFSTSNMANGWAGPNVLDTEGTVTLDVPVSDGAVTSKTAVITDTAGNTTNIQKMVSLELFKWFDSDSQWQINEKARLPKIDHGDEDNSVVMGNLTLKHDGSTIAILDKDNIDFKNPTKVDNDLEVTGTMKITEDLTVTGTFVAGNTTRILNSDGNAHGGIETTSISVCSGNTFIDEFGFSTNHANVAGELVAKKITVSDSEETATPTVINENGSIDTANVNVSNTLIAKNIKAESFLIGKDERSIPVITIAKHGDAYQLELSSIAESQPR